MDFNRKNELQEIYDFSSLNKEILDDLIKKIKNKRIVPYIGAGMSVLFEDENIYPTWGTFLDKTSEHLSPDALTSFNKLDFENKAEFLDNNIKGISFTEILKNSFSPDYLYGTEISKDDLTSKPAYMLPYIFDSDLILTTNFDYVIKRMYELHDQNIEPLEPHSIYNSGIDTITLKLRGEFEDVILFHIHGRVSKTTNSIIITKSQYEKAYSNKDLVEVLKKVYKDNIILYLGCGLNNDRPLDVLRDTIKNEPNYSNYAIVAYRKNENKKEDEIKLEVESRREQLLNDYKIKSIIYPDNNEHKYLKVILDYITYKVNETKYKEYLKLNSDYSQFTEMKNDELLEGLFEFNSETIKEYSKINEVYKDSYFRMSSDFRCIISSILTNNTDTIQAKDSNNDFVDDIKKAIDFGEQIIYISGQGGIGKTTELLSLAIEYKNEKKSRTFAIQLGNKNDNSVVNYLCKLVNNTKEKKPNIKVFIDNPYENTEQVKRILDLCIKNQNLQVILAERTERLDIISDEIMSEIYYPSAMLFLLQSSKTEYHFNKITYYISKHKIRNYRIDYGWKDTILHKIFQNNNADMELLATVMNKVNTNEISIIESFVTIAVEYNRQIDYSNYIAKPPKIILDWGEWKKIFSDDEEREGEKNEKYYKLSDIFRFVAVLDLFKVKTSLELISNLTGIEATKLDKILKDKLPSRKGEPAIYANENGYNFVLLKNDSISSLYFKVEKNDAATCLTEILSYLDEYSIIKYEKMIFKRRYIQGEAEILFNIPVFKLVNIFLENEEYCKVLENNNRLYSLQLAKIWSEKDENKIRKEWAELLSVYNHNEEIGAKVWLSCIDDCERRKIDIPDNFGLKDSQTFKVFFNSKKNNSDMVDITDKYFECIFSNPELNKNQTITIFFFERLLFHLLDERAAFSRKLNHVIDYIDYQKIDKLLSKLDSYMFNRKLHNKSFENYSLNMYQVIADYNPKDIHSRMRLVKKYTDKGKLEEAYDLCQYILDNLSDTNLPTINSLMAILIKNNRKKQIADNKIQEDVETLYEKGINNCKTKKEEAILSITYAGYLLDISNYELAQEKLLYVINDLKEDLGSAYTNLATLYFYSYKHNYLFSIKKAKKYYEKAMNLDIVDVGTVVLYAFYNYQIGNLDVAKQLYEQANQRNPQNKNNQKMLKIIVNEEKKFLNLRKHEFTYFDNIKELAKDFTKNPNKMDDNYYENDVFLLLINWLEDDSFISSDIEDVKQIILTLQNSTYFKYKRDIICYRLIQSVEKKLIDLGYGKTNSKENIKSMCWYIRKFCING